MKKRALYVYKLPFSYLLMAFYETFFPWLLQYMRAEFYNSVEKRKDYCAFSALRLPLAKKRAAAYSDEVLFDAVGL